MVIDLLPGEALLVGEEEAELGEDDEIAHDLVSAHDLLAVDKDSGELRLELGGVDLGSGAEVERPPQGLDRK